MTKHKDFFLDQCLCLDTETNSNDYKVAEVVESGYAHRVDGEWVYHQELYEPVNPIPPKVQSVTYITNEMVKGKDIFTHNSDAYVKKISEYGDGYYVAHNAKFDMMVLANNGINLKESKWICTYRLAKKIFEDMPEIEETNQPYLRFALGLDVDPSLHCHRAGVDCLVTGKLLETLVLFMEDMGLIDVNQPYGEQVYEYSTSPIIYKRFPFGKHKGELISDIPHSYWRWAMEKTDWFNEDADSFDPDLVASINAVL